MIQVTNCPVNSYSLIIFTNFTVHSPLTLLSV